MKPIHCFSLLLCFLILGSCEKRSSYVVEFQLDYSWGTAPGENRKIPGIKIAGVPENTKYLEVQLIDLDLSIANNSDIEKFVYSGNDSSPSGALKHCIGPSPPPQGHRYEFTIKALDEKGVVIGIGRKTKICCPKENERL